MKLNSSSCTDCKDVVVMVAGLAALPIGQISDYGVSLGISFKNEVSF